MHTFLFFNHVAMEQSSYRLHIYNKLFYISYGTILITHTLNNDSCLDKNDMCISGWISPGESIIFQCRATAQEVEIASWLY